MTDLLHLVRDVEDRLLADQTRREDLAVHEGFRSERELAHELNPGHFVARAGELRRARPDDLTGPIARPKLLMRSRHQLGAIVKPTRRAGSSLARLPFLLLLIEIHRPFAINREVEYATTRLRAENGVCRSPFQCDGLRVVEVLDDLS